MNRVPHAVRLLVAAAGLALPSIAMGQVFYSENFNSAVLNQVSGDPRVTAACGSNAPAFTHNPPAGWVNNICGVSSYNCRTGCPPYPGINCAECTNNEGVFEWEGWSFASTAFWGVRTDDQGRRLFTLATGNVAVADSDEWDDRGDPDTRCGYYNAVMSTPAISLAGASLETLAFTFDSSWQYEGFDDGRTATNNQTAIIRAFYTVGGVEQPGVDVLHWDSDDGVNSGSGSPSPFFKPDAPNETVILAAGDLQAPAGATAVRFEFAYLNAANDWWWAMDNLALTADVSGSPATIFAESFESVTLQPPVHEVPTGCGATYCGDLTYTHDGPNGVVVTLDPSVSGGVPDWRGWSFVERDFWRCASGGPNGSAFTNSSGLVAVADGDEFEDIANSPGPLDTTLNTPSIDLSGRTGDVVVLTFNSSWRWEAGQTAILTAEYNTGEIVEVLRFESDQNSPNFKPDAVNELAASALLVPENASSVVLRFRYIGGNNWWWAIDDINVFEGIADITIASVNASRAPMTLAPSIDYAPCFTPWSPAGPQGWSSTFDTLGTCPVDCGVPEWRGWSFANKDWWVQAAGDQQRSQFTLGQGFVAIADPDEWDDAPNGRSNFNAFMTSPSIALPGSISSASFNFASSWRYEGFDDNCSCLPGGERLNNQTAVIRAIYTVGGVEQAPVEVLRWDSDDGSNSGTGVPSAFFKPDNTNEAVTIPASALSIPSGAQSVRFEFSLTNSRNDWWWAVDNLNFVVNGNSVFTENFENPTALQAVAFEPAPVAQCQYWSAVSAQPGNLTVDNSGITGCSDGDDYYGFNAWLVDAWARSQGGLRTQHLAETAFISDFAARGCDGVARLITPSYGIGGVNPDSAVLSFRSGWFAEAGHVSTVEVSYNNGATWVNVLTWNPSNKVSTPDEVVSIGLNNPNNSSTVRVRFSDSQSGWWAVSDIRITGTVGIATGCAADFNGDDFIDFFDYDDYVNCFETGNCPPGKTADFNGDEFVDFFDYDDFVGLFEVGC